ncbi:AAA family ATPase [Ignatzschineria larvae DSM 13226]|uniref:DNA-directed DNA polymerase n=1 Tax=Ignatzschineria larvae DSM 13226 TaxID=1111732 RepID=A0ABZ3C190_9GAMM|nr:DNA polymerase III subunit delta' [Ignatzschineria larvae]
MTTSQTLDFSQLPWLLQDYLRLMTRYRQSDMTPPQSLLLYGERGIGKSILVDHLVAGILCQSISETLEPCGQCQSCRWLASGFHPDLYTIGGEQEIKVDEVRKIHHFAQLTPETGCKIVVIKEADRLNINAANSLLKVLEEPPAELYFILESSAMERLPITVRSRCQSDYIASPDSIEALRCLELITHGTVLPQDLTLLLAISLNAPLSALTLLPSYQEKGRDIIAILECLFAGDFREISQVNELVTAESLTFALLFFVMIASLDLYRGEIPVELQAIVQSVKQFPAQKRLTQYEQLVEINRARTTQTRTAWALEAWFINYS